MKFQGTCLPFLYSKRRKVNFQFMQSSVNTVIATVVAVATELTLSRNRIKDVQGVSSAGQLILLIIGGSLIFRVMCIGIFLEGKSKEETRSDDDQIHTHSMANMPDAASGGGGPPDPVFHFPIQASPYNEYDDLDNIPPDAGCGSG